MNHKRIIATAAAALALTALPASADTQSQGDGHDRFGYIDCYSPSQVRVHGYFIGNVRMAVKDPINGKFFYHAAYKWSSFLSGPAYDGAHMVWHVTDRDGFAWVDRAWAECVLIV